MILFPFSLTFKHSSTYTFQPLNLFCCLNVFTQAENVISDELNVTLFLLPFTQCSIWLIKLFNELLSMCPLNHTRIVDCSEF